MALAMNDKLGALKVQARRAETYYGHSYHVTTELEGQNSESITRSLDTAQEVSRNIRTIKAKVRQIRESHGSMMTSYNNEAAKQTVETLSGEIKKLSHEVHAKLKGMKSEIDSEDGGPDRHSAELRIKKAQYSSLMRIFRDAVEEFNEEQESYREKSKERIRKQLFYAGHSVSQEELDGVLESGNIQIFTQNLAIVTAQKKVALSECESRQRELLELEENIKELHDMFYDIAILIEEQGELVDRIERNVENASVYVYFGRRDVQKAVTYKRSGRKLKWCICCTLSSMCISLLVIAAVVAGIVIALETMDE